MSSLKSFLPILSQRVLMSEASLYERQRVLVRMGLLPTRGGRGPGNGVPLSAASVSWLLVSLLVADSLSDLPVMLRALQRDGDLRLFDGVDLLSRLMDCHPIYTDGPNMDGVESFEFSTVRGGFLLRICDGARTVEVWDHPKSGIGSPITLRRAMSGDLLREITGDLSRAQASSDSVDA